MSRERPTARELEAEAVLRNKAMSAARTRNLAVLLLALVLSAWAARPARAILVGAGSMDTLIRSSDAIARARIISIQRPPFERLAFTAEPTAVLKAPSKALPPRLTLTPAEPIWPDDLELRYRPGAVVLLFLQEDGTTFSVVNNMRAIVPASEGTVIDPNTSMETRVLRELVPVLKGLKTDAARSRLLSLMGEVGSRGNEEIFLPYLKDPNEWVRRGALTALLRINPTPERVEMAAADLKAFLKGPKRGDLFRLWSLYRVIDTENNAYLPLYRIAADAGNVRPLDDAIVRGLKRGGQKEDSLRLYRYVRHKSDYIRHEALDALCRIYKIPLKRPEVTSYQGPLSQEAVDQERRMRAAVTRALQKEGILKQNQS